jgi:hypothetical protein
VAEVRGPLLSISASGSVADAVTFRRARGQNLARAFASPRDVPSASQLAQRTRVKNVVAAWHVYDGFANAADEAAWELRGKQLGIRGGYAAFQHDYLISDGLGHTTLTVWERFTLVSAAHAAFTFTIRDSAGGGSFDQWFSGKTLAYQKFQGNGNEVGGLLTVPAYDTKQSAGEWHYFYVLNVNTVQRSGLYRVKLT